MKKGLPQLVVLLSLVLSLYLFVIWLPAQVREQRGALMARNQPAPSVKFSDTMVASGTAPVPLTAPEEEGLPAGLIEYIQSEQKTAASFSDAMDEGELIDTFESFQQDYALRADDMFKRFENKSKQTDFYREDPAASGDFALSYSSTDFEAPPGLEDIVQFWENIFGVYDKDVMVFHHTRHVGIVYSVLDFRDLAKEGNPDFDQIKQQSIREEKQRLTRLLKGLAEKLSADRIDYAKFTREEQHIVERLERAPEISLASLGDGQNLKITAGYAHRFRQAIAKSGQYMPEMMRIFRRYGLPLELTCIPFVESSFSESALSHAGAAGIWQFIPGTGKRYLRIDDYVDERYDPILSTHAAAKHLMTEYKMLRHWPLAVNSYNTGPGRIQDAVRDLGTADIAEISRRYEGSGYGYDSRNYFPELLAAVKVYRNYRRYFGDINLLPEQTQEYIVMPAATNIKQMFRLAGVSAESMQDLNLMLKPEVLSGDKKLPRGYLVKVMPGAKQDMLMAAHDLYRQTQNAAYHLATKGETLEDIAEMYDVDVADIAQLNHLKDDEKLVPGTMLKLPQDDIGGAFSLRHTGDDNDGNLGDNGIQSGKGFRDGVEAVIEQEMQSDDDADDEDTEENEQTSDIIF